MAARLLGITGGLPIRVALNPIVKHTPWREQVKDVVVGGL